MNCRVNAGPTIDLPTFCATGPTMWGLRNPMCPSVPATVAAPMSLSPSISSLGGRTMSDVFVMVTSMERTTVPDRSSRRLGMGWTGSVGLQGHFGVPVEQVHALLVEFEPDHLVRC